MTGTDLSERGPVNMYDFVALTEAIAQHHKAGLDQMDVHGVINDGEVLEGTRQTRDLTDLAGWILEEQTHRLDTIDPKRLALIFKLATFGIINENAKLLRFLANSKTEIGKLKSANRIREVVAELINTTLSSGAKNRKHVEQLLTVARDLGLNITVFQSSRKEAKPGDVIIEKLAA